MSDHKIHPCPSCGCDGISPCVCTLTASGVCTVCDRRATIRRLRALLERAASRMEDATPEDPCGGGSFCNFCGTSKRAAPDHSNACKWMLRAGCLAAIRAELAPTPKERDESDE